MKVYSFYNGKIKFLIWCGEKKGTYLSCKWQDAYLFLESGIEVESGNLISIDGHKYKTKMSPLPDFLCSSFTIW